MIPLQRLSDYAGSTSPSDTDTTIVYAEIGNAPRPPDLSTSVGYFIVKDSAGQKLAYVPTLRMNPADDRQSRQPPQITDSRQPAPTALDLLRLAIEGPQRAKLSPIQRTV
jgi:hypothetical protein